MSIYQFRYQTIDSVQYIGWPYSNCILLSIMRGIQASDGCNHKFSRLRRFPSSDNSDRLFGSAMSITELNYAARASPRVTR